ncbi:MAG TPA: alpha-L-fucosidase [Opitutales bacterium]|nr:alpha-L-fucosidase [Opitutales bacterium]
MHPTPFPVRFGFAVSALSLILCVHALAQATAQAPGTYPPRDKTRFPDALMPTAESAATHTSPIDQEMAGLTHLPPVPKPIPDGPVQPTWDSLKANYQTPDWFRDAKFGIYIHWGLYSVAAYHNEWYSMHMYNTFADYHAATFGPQNVFGYKDFIPFFKAEKYDPAAWAKLFKEAGAKYVVPVVEHHDGFAMWDSDITIWCAGKMGPKRDLIGDLAKAVRAEGLIFGVSNHRIEHHTFMYPKDGLPNDQFDPKYAEFYGPPQPGGQRNMNGGDATPAFQADWLARAQEVADEYHPQMFIFDNGINTRAYDDIKLKFAAYYYNQAAKWGVPVTIDTKQQAYLAGSIQDYETHAPTGLQPFPWQVQDKIAGNSWGYSEANSPMTYRSPASIITELITCAADNGNLLLNISPRGDGSIPQQQQDILLAVGKWLGVNGEAIYGTRPWAVAEEGNNIHFTTKPGALYALISNARPASAVTIASLPKGYPTNGKIEKVTLLGQAEPLPFTQDANGLSTTLPATLPTQYASVLKVEMSYPTAAK